jgi:hypothetical protein
MGDRSALQQSAPMSAYSSANGHSARPWPMTDSGRFLPLGRLDLVPDNRLDLAVD